MSCLVLQLFFTSNSTNSSNDTFLLLPGKNIFSELRETKLEAKDGVLGALQSLLLLHPRQTLPLRGLHGRAERGRVPGGREVLEPGRDGVPGGVHQAREVRAGLQCQPPGQGGAPPRVLDPRGRGRARLERVLGHRQPRQPSQQGQHRRQ